MDTAQPAVPTHYQSSRGPLLITDMPFPHLTAAVAKMERDGRTGEPAYPVMLARRDALTAEYEAAQAANPGTNGAPEPTPFEAIRDEMESLRVEAGHWLDGAEITSQAEADKLGTLLRIVQAAAKRADEARKAEKKPFDDGAAQVQERYNPLIGNTTKVKGVAVRIEEALKVASTKWLRKVAAEQEAARQEAARIAEEARQRAEAHVAATHDTTDMDDRDAALAEVDRAREAAFAFAAANREKAQSQVEVGRAIGLVTTWRAEITDRTAALRHYYTQRPEDFEPLVMEFARQDIRAGKHSGVPGITIIPEQVAR